MTDDSTPHVLLVEDDVKTADTVALYLRHAGMRVSVTASGEDGLERALHDAIDLVILDRMLPDGDGAEVCARIRALSSVPIVLLTARAEEADRLFGFARGADDYVVKPFSPRELVARAEAFLRREQVRREKRSGLVRVGPLRIDPDGGDAWAGSTRIALSPTEFRVLHVLAQAAGRVFSREELIDRAVRGRAVDTRVVDAHVKNLRRKLGRAGVDAQVIRTVPGRGYKAVRDVGRG